MVPIEKIFGPSCTNPALFVHDALVFGPSCTKPPLFVHDALVFVPSCTKPALFVHDTLVFVPSCTKPPLFVHDTLVLASNRFRLGGKESQTFGSLDLGEVDFCARMYDPFTAGWTTANPLAVARGPIMDCQSLLKPMRQIT